MKIAVLDDYQNVALKSADWSAVAARAEITVFNDHLTDSSAIIERLNTEINAGIGDAKFKARFAALGGTVMPGSPADFGKLIRDETEKWAKVIRAANIKPI